MAVKTTCLMCGKTWNPGEPSQCACGITRAQPLIVVAVLALCMAMLCGCQTIAIMNRMGRVVPQVEHLIYLQDQENRHPAANGVKADLCAGDQAEREELVAIANLMGWRPFPRVDVDGRPHCLTVFYEKEK